MRAWLAEISVLATCGVYLTSVTDELHVLYYANFSKIKIYKSTTLLVLIH